MAKYDVARWDELDGVVKKVRRALGVTAFGVNYFDRLPRDLGIYPNGHALADVDHLAVDPQHAGAGEDGLQWVAIGAPREGAYEPPSWG